MVAIHQKVKTPYGTAIVEKIDIRTNDRAEKYLVYVARPTSWKLANNLAPRFYLNPNDVKPFFQVGDEITTVFGAGKIINHRDEDNIYIVQLDNWKLATGKSPTLYLNQDAIAHAIKKEKINEQFSFDVLYKKATEAKEKAKTLYQEKKFFEAKVEYAKALEVIKVWKQQSA